MLLAAAFVGGVVFVWSGFYNVAASSDHWAVTTWILEQVRVRSIAVRSYFVEKPPPLDDPDLVRLGAGHYEGGCAPCHSRPGEPINAIVGEMLPPPPILAGSIGHETPRELFWIIKHGLKYTAMPAWPAQERHDEVWALTAFVNSLPGMSPEEYRELAGVGRPPQDPPESEDLAESSETVALTQCVRCHGGESSPPISELIPILHGQSEAYLARALAEYAARLRSSGVMEPVVGLLGTDQQAALAAYYAGLQPLAARQELEPERIRRGRELASKGDPERGVPACLSCHSENHAPEFPTLAGQYAAYLANQLRVWRGGGRDRTAYGQIMATVARRLTDRQIEDVAAYFASLGAGEAGAKVAASGAAR